MIRTSVLASPIARRGLGSALPLASYRASLVLARRDARSQRVEAPARVSRAWESTSMGDDKTGHIASAPNESILFFDNLFPLRLTPLLKGVWRTDRDVSDLLQKFNSESLTMLDPINLVKRALANEVQDKVKVTEIIPRLKDGGAYVKFSHSADVPANEIEGSLSKALEKNPIKPWFNPWRGIKAGLVHGVPWLEDLYRFPKSRLRVEFVPPSPGENAAELSQEALFSLFRKYGKIAELTSQPTDSKVLPKYAYVDFVLVRDAIMARNCLHGFVAPEAMEGGKNGTKLRLSYEERVKAHQLWGWITSHPRIVIPIVAALLAAVTVVIFDPIREWFIKAHVQHSFKFSNSRLYKWFKRQTSDILAFRRQKGEQAGLQALYSHRKDIIEALQTWLLETADTFIVVQGPRGDGKKELILDQALSQRDNVLVLDCKPIIEARGEAGTIKKLAAEVGYRPVFSWANNLSSLIDLAVQSTTGVKAGFSETLESQVVKILQTSAAALKQVSLAGRKKNDVDAHLSEDAYLEAHPERRAVIVIDNFLHKNDDKTIIYDKIAEWAAAIVQSNVAHVVFLTNDNSYSKSLSKSLPDRVFRQLSLGDLSPDVAKQYVISHLEAPDSNEEKRAPESDEEKKAAEKEAAEKKEHHDRELAELDECIDQLGGRLTDLQYLARRLKAGQGPKRAVNEIIEQSASEILKMFLLAGSGADSADKKWSAEQAWYLIKEIAAKESLRYNEVLLENTFSSSLCPGAGNGEAALESLANAELITVKSHKGRPQSIQAGKPVYQAAFSMLITDRVLKSKMDLAILTELAKIEAKNIEKVEVELTTLGTLPKQPYQTTERVNYLLNKLQASQTKIANLEREMASQKKLLQHEA